MNASSTRPGPTIKNCYTVGKTTGNSAFLYTLPYAVSFTNYPTNCFYLSGSYKYAAFDQVTYQGITAKDETYMKSQSFVDELNNGEDVWTRDDDINEGYPILRSIKYRK